MRLYPSLPALLLTSTTTTSNPVTAAAAGAPRDHADRLPRDPRLQQHVLPRPPRPRRRCGLDAVRPRRVPRPPVPGGGGGGDPYAVIFEAEWRDMDAVNDMLTKTPDEEKRRFEEDEKRFTDRAPVVWVMGVGAQG
ncbi:hypothetical protein PG993_003064 [Apiospora rasikravindrae]|uniref:DUF1330 domain-containing protein n=1 Tax=Apiospora rasikravindrae TaxID=990691 RepID=A0ABR1U166_9PEZI